MKKFIGYILLLTVGIVLKAQTAEMVNVEVMALGEGFGLPKIVRGGVDEQILRRKGYVTSYNKRTKCPNWVAWRLVATDRKLTREEFGRAKKRNFHEDTDVKSPRATPEDYKGVFKARDLSRGHMCPKGDCRWSVESGHEADLLTNICPQNSNLNQGAWQKLENKCRQYAKKEGSVVVVCGPIFYKRGGRNETIGKNRVVVPDAFYKIVIHDSAKKPWSEGYIYKNEIKEKRTDGYVNTVEQIERITGIHF